MSDPNRFGLHRHIPEPIARTIRRRCGFGCVICGESVINYEHFDPEFVDAMSHKAEGITLLCPTDHLRKGSTLSLQSIVRANAHPYCKKAGFTRTSLDLSETTVEVGPFISIRCKVIIEAYGEKLVWFDPPEEPDGPNQFNLRLRDQDGKDVVWIENNVWHAVDTAHDIQITNGKNEGTIEVRDEDGILFKSVTVPPNYIGIEVFRSWHREMLIGVGFDKQDRAVFSIDGHPQPGTGSPRGRGFTSIGNYAACSIG